MLSKKSSRQFDLTGNSEIRIYLFPSILQANIFLAKKSGQSSRQAARSPSYSCINFLPKLSRLSLRKKIKEIIEICG